MPRDAYGLPVTTGAASALEAYDRAVGAVVLLAQRVARRPDHLWKTRTGRRVAPGVN